MKLSIILPGIRPGNWKRLYDSINTSFSEDTSQWELVIISPYQMPKAMKDKSNVKLIKDYGSPTRAQQLGLSHCTGEYVSWAADDGYYLGVSLKAAVDTLDSGAGNSLVVGRYYEGSENPFMATRKYYLINTHDGSRSKFIPNNCLMIMVGVVPRLILVEVGGWDSLNFEGLPMAFNDLSVRLNSKKVNFIFQEDMMMFRCSHMPGHQGDHGPIHDAQTEHDEHVFRGIYSQMESTQRITIDYNNWKHSPERWIRRFGNV